MVVDQVTVPPLGPDQSYARTSDGASSWEITSTPTIDASNASLQVTPTAISSSTGPAGPGGSGGTRTTSGSINGDHKVLIDGVQPQWNRLQFPSTAPTASVDLHPTTHSMPTPSPANNGPDLTRHIVLTALVIALALTLFWCWKLFKKA